MYNTGSLKINVDNWGDLVRYIKYATNAASHELSDMRDKIVSRDHNLMQYAEMYSRNIMSIADRLYVIADLLNDGFDKFNDIYTYED